MGADQHAAWIFRKSRRLFGALLAGAALIAALGSAGGAVAATRLRVCAATDLSAAVSSHVAAVTQENPILITLKNRTRFGCALHGYPEPALLSARDVALPFVVARSGDRQVTSHRPTLVRLPAGRTAFVLLAMASCETRSRTLAWILELGLPGGSRRVRLRLRVPATFCGRGDVGSTVHVSPFEPTFLATTAGAR